MESAAYVEGQKCSPEELNMLRISVGRFPVTDYVNY